MAGSAGGDSGEGGATHSQKQPAVSTSATTLAESSSIATWMIFVGAPSPASRDQT